MFSNIWDFPSCVRSQFRAWVHRLTTIIFTELMAKTSTQQEKAHLALPCLKGKNGKNGKKILLLEYLGILGQWFINSFLLFQNRMDLLPACTSSDHFAYTQHSMINLLFFKLYFFCHFSGKQIFMAGMLVSEKLQARIFYYYSNASS